MAVIGAALDLGAGRRGVDMGPSAIRYAGLDVRLAELGIECVDWGNVETVIPEAADPGDPKARFLGPIMQANEQIAGRVVRALREERVPLVLGGDHSVAIGTLGGLASAHNAGAVLWFDAHGDLNTPETTPSGNVHGMPLAAALGLAGDAFASDAWPLPAIQARRSSLIGVRQVDAGERALIQELDIATFTMTDLDRRGVEECLSEALERARGAAHVHVSLDMDVVDPEFAPGVGTPVRGGLSYREAHLSMELVAESGLMGSLEVVEVNPVLDRENETGKLAVELTASAFGASIL